MEKKLNSNLNSKLNAGVIVGKNKDYRSVQEAQLFYEQKRLKELAMVIFPEDEYPEDFKTKMISLMKFQNPVQMGVWHNKMKSIIDQETGERILTTWENMCSFGRKFTCAEMYQCIEVLKRATPNELFDYDNYRSMYEKLDESLFFKTRMRDMDNDKLIYFNEHAYPKIEEMMNKLQFVLDSIEEQICAPIRAKINSDLKVMMQIPVGENVVFIKPKERKL